MHEFASLADKYGLSLVFLNVLLEQLGVPVPALPTVIVAGALVAAGRLSGVGVLGAVVAACMFANAVWYLAGLRYGNAVMKALCRISLSPDSCVRQTEIQFDRFGATLLVFAKFVPLLSTIAPPLAGAMRVGWPSFLLFNSLGSVAWGAAGIGAGFLFHRQIYQALAHLEAAGAMSGVLLLLLVAGYVLFKYWQRRRFYKVLRMARISVDELHDLMRKGDQPVIVDVRSPSVRARDGRRIPGALLIDFESIDEHIQDLPTDRDIILYCTCPNEASAARVAKLLIDRGFTRVRPLQGGFEAWTEAGLSVEELPMLRAERPAASRMPSKAEND